jgi:ABC-2 type transport system permease protein
MALQLAGVAKLGALAHISKMRDLPDTVLPPEPRRYAGVNWIGLQALYAKEVRRFWKVGLQTVGAPVLTSLLYMLVFSVATSGARPQVDGVSFAAFVAPGLIMMTILNNAFANSSSSLLQSKMMGLTQDFLTPPLSPLELTIGFTLGATTRGVMVGIVTWLCVEPFAHLGFAHPWAVAYYALAACLIMSLTGVLTALWAVKFDHLATVTNFVIMPLTFLSGTFYSVQHLPPVFRAASQFNPFFYLIDGFRYGFIGRSEHSLGLGVAFIAVLAAVLGGLVWQLFRTGYRLKT